ncbi:uncharacterized protein SAPINGB_P004858 [Magnusiomyces paraingens]|uniref:Ribosomal RNA-processing protein 42 n=1 Tax=Magnusiomyces paraingens TaxID=2606893 RepID=A0A5E8BXB1_9ASCO|nr:uncharacterized protein SAPINGB_P004858 [Saprochaete ingens]VVT56147.1 unnamed protein product [Saprochaete ingens]
MVRLSPAEYSYLRSSLETVPPVRPDARTVAQFRPLQAATNFMPTCYGSARVRTADGGECIVGVKAKVARTVSAKLINVSIDMSGTRDDDPALANIALTFEKLLQDSPILTAEKLRLTSRFSFTLFIDALVLAHNGNNPLNLLSLTIYLALMSTRLPKLISSTDDSAAEEIPVFDDDWENSVPLTGLIQGQAPAPRHDLLLDGKQITPEQAALFYKTTPWKPPILFVFAVIGNSILIDPSLEEEAVADGTLTIGWQQGKVVAPLRYLETYSSSSTAAATSFVDPSAKKQNSALAKSGGINLEILKKAYELALDAGSDVAESLDLIIKLDREEEAESGPPAMF